MTSSVIFDMGNVLIDWDRHRPLAPFFSSEGAAQTFFASDWRLIYDAVHDGDGDAAVCLAPLRAARPDLASLIDFYAFRWGEFIVGPIEPSVGVLRELAERGVRLFGLTNWPVQMWPPERTVAAGRFDFSFLELFEDIVVSGVEKCRKPDVEIYRRALARFGLDASDAMFVDDLKENVDAASSVGIAGHHYQGPERLREALVAAGLLD